MDHRELWRPDGQLVMQLRRERGLSRARLAQIAGVSHHTVAKVERGEPIFPATLSEIARALHLPAEALRIGAEPAPPLSTTQRNLCDALRSRYELYQAAVRDGGFDLIRREFPKGMSRSVLWTYASTRDVAKMGVYEGSGGVVRFFEHVLTEYRLGEQRVEEITPMGRRQLLARGVETFAAPGIGDCMSVWMHLCEFDRRGRLVVCRISADIQPAAQQAAPIDRAELIETGEVAPRRASVGVLWQPEPFRRSVVRMSDPATLVETLRRRGIVDERVLNAIAFVDRARFVPAEYQQYAWDDNALPIAGGQTISQPYIVALMSEALELRGGETVLEIGTGSGYQAAVLCRLCERVVSVERLPELQRDAQAVLAEIGCENILFRVGDGTLGSADDAPFDGVVVTAGAPEVPPALYEQLKDGGRLVIPVGPIEQQELVVITKTSAGPQRRSLCGCRFVKLIGEQGWHE